MWKPPEERETIEAADEDEEIPLSMDIKTGMMEKLHVNIWPKIHPETVAAYKSTASASFICEFALLDSAVLLLGILTIRLLGSIFIVILSFWSDIHQNMIFFQFVFTLDWCIWWCFLEEQRNIVF